MSTKVLVPSGVLGLGFSEKALESGLKRNPDIISIDGGSTDSGPFYLGTGTTKYSEEICKKEWRVLMQARHRLNIPLMIGSCGTCGTNSMVDWMFQLTLEIAKDLGQDLKIVRVYCEREKDALLTAFRSNALKPLNPILSISEEEIGSFSNIVALAGAEVFQSAINQGADIVLVGRATDTAIISALPLLRQEDKGASWHGAKIAECGAFCSTNPQSGVILLEVDKNGFTVEAMAEDALCSPESVSAHMLYENSNPFILNEPGGSLDVSDAQYQSINNRQVRVTGSKWLSDKEYTVKLEAAKLSGFQTVMLATIREKYYVDNVVLWTEKLKELGREKVKSNLNLKENTFDIDVRIIGRNSALGDQEKSFSKDLVEVGVLVIITARTQKDSSAIASILNPYLLHLPLQENTALPTFSFPFSPASIDKGELYEFALHHVEVLKDPTEGFEFLVDEVRYG